MGAPCRHVLPWPPMNALADGTLARQAASGDRAAFATLYDRFNGEIYGFSQRLLSNPADAADVTQDVFVRAIEKLPQLREPDRVRAWLFTIARHECYARTKRRGRTMATDPLDLAADMASTSRSTAGIAEANELTQLVWEAAKGLAPEDRAVLDLKLKRDLDGADLAEALGIPHDQLHKVTGRAMERFERSIVSLVLARGARRDCSVLAGLVETDDVELTPVLRKRIARHAQDCDACERRRKVLVNPSTMVASAHEVGPASSLRDRVLEAAFSGSLSGTSSLRSLSWGSDGFPKLRSGRAKLLTIAALAGVLLGGLFASGVGSDDTPKPVVVQQSGSADTLAPLPASSVVPVPSGIVSTRITITPVPPQTSVGPAINAVVPAVPISPTSTSSKDSVSTISRTSIVPVSSVARVVVPVATRLAVSAGLASSSTTRATSIAPASSSRLSAAALPVPTKLSNPAATPSLVPSTLRKPRSTTTTKTPRATTAKPLSVITANTPTIPSEDPTAPVVEATLPVSTIPPIIYPDAVPVDPSRAPPTAPSSPATAVLSPQTTQVVVLPNPPTTSPSNATQSTVIPPVTQTPPMTTTTMKCALTQVGCGFPNPNQTTTTISIRLTPVCCISINPGILLATTTKPPIFIK
jgi:RNA polymerase sigma factor (sigma-70 family)